MVFFGFHKFHTICRADDKSTYQDSLVIVDSGGNVFWPPITHLHSFCRMDVTYFPYDDQFFFLKFGSWSHSGDLVDVEIRNDGVDLSNYIPNGEWELVATRATRNVIYYPCCPEPFPDLTFCKFNPFEPVIAPNFMLFLFQIFIFVVDFCSMFSTLSYRRQHYLPLLCYRSAFHHIVRKKLHSA